MTKLKHFFLGKVRSRYYAALYLLCIPLFASFYVWCAGDFLHSTVQYEGSLNRDLSLIRGDLASALNRHIGNQFKGEDVVNNGWKVVGNKVALGGGKVIEDELRFNLELDLYRNDQNGPERLRGNGIILSVTPTGMPMINDEGEAKWIMKRLRFDGEFAGVDPYQLLVNPPKELNAQGVRVPFLPIPIELENRLGAFFRAKQGFPDGASGQWGRMLYLSAVTITTLGYGDIVPLTSTARFLVSAEAILGVVLIGYYLTSLANAVQTGGSDRKLIKF